MEWSFNDEAMRAMQLRSPSPRPIVALTFILLTMLFTPPVTAQAADLFTSVDAPPPSLPAADLTLRSRIVTMDLGQVQRAQAAVAEPPVPTTRTRDVFARTDKQSTAPALGTILTLNLFDDTVVTGIVERTAPTFSGGYSVSGRITDEPLGTLTLVVNGETVAGTVRLPGETYRIRSVGEGLYAVSEVEEPPLNCEVEEAHFEPDHQH